MKTFKWWFTVMIVFFIYLYELLKVVSAESKLVDAEKRLLKTLFNTYDKKLKPADSVEIKFALNLNQIITLIEQEQIIVLNVFLDHEWIDERLSWDPNEYANISLMRINSENIWS